MNLYAFNDAIKTIFTNKENEHLLHKKCGNAIGCAYAVEEQVDCGLTSMCKYCELRVSALTAYTTKKPVLKQRLSREFFKTSNLKEMKHLLFSARPFNFNNDYYVMVIVEDVSLLVKQCVVIDHQKEMINTLCNT
jgi:sigma-B regulation protein RsbU (phosphoserine phosphatase)